MVCIEDLVPQDHLLRKIENAIDFGFVYDEVKGLYSSDNGRPSIDPVCLVKLCVINYLYGYNSMRRTIRECEVNMAYRWFIGYGIEEKVPHFSTVTYFYGQFFYIAIMQKYLAFRIEAESCFFPPFYLNKR